MMHVRGLNAHHNDLFIKIRDLLQKTFSQSKVRNPQLS
jgi:hypothetical protein